MLKNIASLLGKKEEKINKQTLPRFKYLDAKDQGTHYTYGENPGINRSSVLKKHHHYVKSLIYNLNVHEYKYASRCTWFLFQADAI